MSGIIRQNIDEFRKVTISFQYLVKFCQMPGGNACEEFVYY